MTEIECKGKKSRLWRTISHRIVGISWSQDSTRFVATMHDNSLRLVNLSPGTSLDDRSMIKLTGHSLEHLLISATFLQSHDDSTERILIGSEDRYMYCYRVPTTEDASDNNYNYDKVRVSKELMTSCIPTCSKFDQFLNDEIHNALTKQLGNAGGSSNDELSSNNKESVEVEAIYIHNDKIKSNLDRWKNPRYIGAIIGTVSGIFKVIINFGIEG